MTAERMAPIIEPLDASAEAAESPGKAIVGATLTFIARAAAWSACPDCDAATSSSG